MRVIRTWFLVIFSLTIVVGLAGFVSGLHPVLANQGESHDFEEAFPNGLGGTTEDLEKKKQEIAELEAKIKSLQEERNTLSSAIRFLDSKILLTQKEIEKSALEIQLLETQIEDLTQRIKGLEINLHELSRELIQRVQDQYKRSSTDSVSFVFAATGLTNFFKEQKYLVQVRAHTQELLLNTEAKKQQYDEEKKNKEQKQAEVEALRNKLQAQQQDLERQKRDKNKLLTETQNNEQVYQNRLALALAEFNAIQSIVAGRGSESPSGPVKTGDTIASVISGRSVCSTGTHLHFEVVKNGAHVNPAGYLKPESIVWYDDSFGFSGDWEWPLENPAVISQGYGMTSFARQGFYGGRPHTGIDMLSKSYGNLKVRAVRDGELFRGSVKCGSGNLRYVRVKHTDELSSYYLHVNY